MASSTLHLPFSGGLSRLPRQYRLVDSQGELHPVLDDLYDSPDAAWAEAQRWWSEVGTEGEPMQIGMQVSTASGDWRTLRPPCC
jgi:hypothetical protein